MATLSDIGVPGCGKGVLLPYRLHVESEWVYYNRCQFVRDNEHEKAERLKKHLQHFLKVLYEEDLLPHTPPDGL